MKIKSSVAERHDYMLRNVHAKLKPHVIELIRRMEKEGYVFRVHYSYRSLSEQAALYARGRTKPGRIVTNARPGYSVHNYLGPGAALAVDLVGVSESGDWSWSSQFPWGLLASNARRLGLESGYYWRFTDPPHVQFTGGLSVSKLRAGYKPDFNKLKPLPPARIGFGWDIPLKHWAREPVRFLYEKKILSGYPDKSFRGKEIVDRYAFAVALYKTFLYIVKKSYRLEDKMSEKEFKDVPKTHWARKAIVTLHNYGILTGYADSTFRGQESVNRYELAMALYKLIKATSG